tara:strand:+ start:134 stop:865 length:732 start_codon:yes stop_codon:yes gene_type:complete
MLPDKSGSVVTSVSLILPTYNEKENILQLIPQLESAFQDVPLEIIVVDDQSPDGTAAAAEALNEQYKNVRAIRRNVRRGLGAAVRNGYDEARHDILISCDADGSFLASDLVKLAKTLKEGHDLVLGSRHIEGAKYETPRWPIQLKYHISYLGNLVLRKITGLPIHDFSSNCRAIRRDVWNAIQTQEQTNALLLETILKVSRKGGRITEVPVTFADRRAGQSKLNLWIEIPKFLIPMWRHLLAR